VAPESITTNRNFKVKHGLDVADGGTFGSTVTVATPTQNQHAATKLYVDTAVGSPQIPVSGTAPVSPENGDLWFDTVTQRVHVYYSSQWLAIATLEDAETLQDHIHDTSIDGTGLVVSRFIDAGFYYEPGVLVSGGLYNTASFEATYDGGIATDNFN
jgi:hypothetical protein